MDNCWTRPTSHLANCLQLSLYKFSISQTSLVIQWLRICLPNQGTCVRSLVQEDPMCLRATKPMHHNERIAPCSPKLKKVLAQQRRPSTAKKKKLFFNKGIFHSTALLPLALGENQTPVRAKAWRSRVK